MLGSRISVTFVMWNQRERGKLKKKKKKKNPTFLRPPSTTIVIYMTR